MTLRGGNRRFYPIRAGILMTEERWDSFFDATEEEHREEIDETRDAELDLGRRAVRAREALLRGERNWPQRVKSALRHGKRLIMNLEYRQRWMEWIDGSPNQARAALEALWSEDDRSPGDRVNSFDERVPEGVFTPRQTRTRIVVASHLLTGIDPQQYPSYVRAQFDRVYERLGFPQRRPADDLGSEYEHALDLLDHVFEKAQDRGLDWPKTRLDARSVAWAWSHPNFNP